MSGGGAGLMPAHLPVLFAEVMDGLAIKADGTYLDGTFGRGGHARGVLQRLGPQGQLLVMDKDPEAIAVAMQLASTDARLVWQRGSFVGMAQWPAAHAGLDGVLLDLGVSSPQLDVAERGFSFGKDGPLDMRMDPESGESAAQWLARASEKEIADVLWLHGEERQSRRIARAIVAQRATEPLLRTAQLAALIAQVMPRGDAKIHPATRSFQAIRIHINRELGDLEEGLNAALAQLKPGGRLAVISFHSLEDRIVKKFFAARSGKASGSRHMPAAFAQPAHFDMLTRQVVTAGEVEAEENPRARSAKLRAALRTAEPAGKADPSIFDLPSLADIARLGG